MNISSGQKPAGLFAYLAPGSTIKNLIVSGSVTGQNFVGGIVGVIKNDYDPIPLEYEKDYGIRITNCTNLATVRSNGEETEGAGGILGG